MSGAGGPRLDDHSSPLLEFGSGNLAAKAAGQDLPRLGMCPAAQLTPHTSAGIKLALTHYVCDILSSSIASEAQVAVHLPRSV